MTDSYTPPQVWTWDKESGGRFSKINRPVAGATLAVKAAHVFIPIFVAVVAFAASARLLGMSELSEMLHRGRRDGTHAISD